MNRVALSRLIALPYRDAQVGLKLCYRDRISHQTNGRETGYWRV
jgi:hypothetical protein